MHRYKYRYVLIIVAEASINIRELGTTLIRGFFGHKITGGEGETQERRGEAKTLVCKVAGSGGRGE